MYLISFTVLKENIDRLIAVNNKMWVNAKWYPILIALSIFIIIFIENDITKKTIFAWYSFIMIIVIYNPITVWISTSFFGPNIDYYCRMFLIIPVFALIGYAVTLITKRVSGFKKFVVILFFLGFIYSCGFSAYDEENTFTKADNMKNVPRDVIDLSELLNKDCGEGYKNVIIPGELKLYTRQLDASILIVNMPALDVNDVEYCSDFMQYVRDNKCDYFLCPKEKKVVKAFKKQDAVLVGKTKNYAVFKDVYNFPKREYDTLGRMISEYHYDVDGELLIDDKGIAGVEWEYDNNNNLVGEYYYDDNKESCEMDSGEHGFVNKYDKDNRLVMQTYVDVNDNPVMTKRKYASVGYSYNEVGQKMSVSYYDENNKLICLPDSWASIRYEYNEMGLVVSEYYYDENNRPMAMSAGQYGIKKEYSDNKLLIKMSYVDSLGNSQMISSGYAIIHYDYLDDTGLYIHEVYCDDKDEPIMLSAGYSAREYTKDAGGYILSEYYFDENNQAVALSDGQYGCVKEYDNAHNVIKLMYVNSLGEPILVKSGYAIVYYSDYYDNGSTGLVRWCDDKDNPIANSSGYYGIKYIRDGDGYVLEEYYLDKDGNTMELLSGQCGRKYSYNSEHKVVKYEYLNADGEVTMLKAGYAVVTYNGYDKNGNASNERYYDKENKPVINNLGYAGIDYTRDSEGRIVCYTYVALSGEPINNSSGYAYCKLSYDKNGDILSEKYYDTKGNEICIE